MSEYATDGYRRVGEAVRRRNRERWACFFCGMTSSRGAIGRHQKATGHRGVVRRVSDGGSET